MYKNITLYLNTLYIYIYKQKHTHTHTHTHIYIYRYSRWGGMGQAKSILLSSPSRNWPVYDRIVK